jgi:DNA replication protein DnaC
LSQAQDSKIGDLKALYGAEEAHKIGLTWDTEPPEPEPCVYCGKTLYRLGVRHKRKIIIWLDDPERCDCRQAKDYWAEYDAEKARRELAMEEEERNRKKRERIERLIGSSGIKKRFLTRTFENYNLNTQNRMAFEIAKEYAVNFTRHAEKGDGLYFEGPVGTGKTHLAVAISLRLMDIGIPCVCKTSIDILNDIKSSFDAIRDFDEKAILDAYKDVELLVVDDLGKEMATEWSMATLYNILNDRYEKMRPTIVTTNYNDRSLISRMTPRGMDNTNMAALISRLRETTKVVTMDWSDYRLGGAAARAPVRVAACAPDEEGMMLMGVTR